VTYTSSFSVADLLLARRGGLRPLGQVFGACAYQIGFAARPYTSGGTWPGYPRAGYVELGGPTRAWNHAREQALAQLRSEAVNLGADAVVGVSFRRRLRGGRLGLVEFVINGTAVTTGSDPSGIPMLTMLSGSEVEALQQAGYTAKGMVAASTVTQVLPGYRTSYAYSGRRPFSNQELPDLSHTAVAARANVLGRLHKQRRGMDADGLIGVTYDQHIEPDEGEGHRVTVTLHVAGTAISGPRLKTPSPQLALALDQEST
jgi:uncharacterized protein YbjQ (UPF0145 family)